MRVLNVNEIGEVNGGHPAVWLGAYIVRTAIKHYIKKHGTITSVAAGAGANHATREYK